MAVLRYFHQPPKATTSTVVVNNTAILTVSAALNNKVDKSAGRGLSQNNYSTPEKNKLKGVEEGAEVNVLADWNELNIESDAYIQNKPESLPASDVYEWAKQPTKPVYTPTEIGLGNVTNDAQVKRSEMGIANGVATLNQDGLVPATQLPSYVDDVLEYSSVSLFPMPGTDGKIYVDTTTNLTYRWSGSDYVEISKSLALGETSSTAYRGDRGKTAYTHATDSSRLTTATSVGLYKVGCTAQGHISSLTAITKADITGLGIPAQDTNTTYSFAGGTNKFTVTPSGGTAQDVTVTPSISAATQSAAGLMSAADKKKLDGIAAGAQVNSVTGVKGNSESSYRTGNVNITATNIGLSNVANLDLSKAIKSITRSGTTFTYTCLDGTTGTFTQLDNNTTYSAGTGLSLSNTTFSLALTKKLVTDALGYTPPTTDTNTTYSAGSGLSLSGTTFSLALTKALVTTALGYTPPTSDTNTWRTVLCNGTSIGNNTLNLKAGTNVTLSNSNGTITISSTDTNTWPSKVSLLTNDSGYITGITKAMVTNALGYTPPTTDTNTTYNFAGVSFTSGQSNTGEHNANNITSNGVWYYTSNGPATSLGASTSDGALYSQAYSTSWVGQIAQDYRNGNLFTRGKNNGTWKSWRKIFYSDDTYAGTLTKSQVTTALGYTPPTSDTNTWRTVLCNGTSIGNNTLNIKAGTNVSLSNSNGTITISSTDTNTWRPLGTGASDACAGNDSRLSNSRPASDVYSWAKASTKPSYAWSEITSKPCSFYSGTCSKTTNGNLTVFYVSMSAADAAKVYSMEFVPNTDIMSGAVGYNVNFSSYPANAWIATRPTSQGITSCTYRYIKA